MFRIILMTVVIAVVGVLGWMAAHIIPASGALDRLDPMLVDKCARIDVAPGTEDIAIDPERRIAYVSAGERREWYNAGAASKTPESNGIYIVSLDDFAATPIRATPMRDDFMPHGIDLWIGPDGERRLFVVTHPPSGKEIVEIFDVAEDGMLTLAESVSFDAMYSPNDVAAVGRNSFYASNDRRHDSGVMADLETYLALPLTDVVYYDGVKGDVAAKGLVYANGVETSHDGTTLYVAEVLKRRISVFDRDLASGALTLDTRWRVNTAPDNISVAKDGSLYVAGHSRIFDFVKHAEDANHVAPSHVVRVHHGAGRRGAVFIATYGEINGSSVGAAWDDTLLVGAVFDGHILACPL